MSEWISVEDYLPEESVVVLTYLKDGRYLLNYIIKLTDIILWACVLDNENDKVTHWMPLPEPPGK